MIAQSRRNASWRTGLGRLRQYEPIEIDLGRPDTDNQSDPNVTFAIATPSLDQDTFVASTIASVLDQNYPGLQYIVQDGASSDSTKTILEDWAKRGLSFNSEPDTGQANAINRGFAHVDGEIMAWLNSDDMLLPGSLEAVARVFQSHPEVDVVYGHRINIDANGREIGRWIMPKHKDEILTWADYIPQETMFWRRSIWDAAGGELDESFRFALDWDLILRFRDQGATFFSCLLYTSDAADEA